MNTLTAEPFDIWTRKLVEGCIWTISWILKFDTQGHRSRSPGQKTRFSRHIKGENECAVHVVMTICHVTSRHASNNELECLSGKISDEGTTLEGHQRSGVFIFNGTSLILRLQ